MLRIPTMLCAAMLLLAACAGDDDTETADPVAPAGDFRP